MNSSVMSRYMNTLFTCIGYNRDLCFQKIRLSPAWSDIRGYCCRNHAVKFEYEKKIVISGYISMCYFLLREEYMNIINGNNDMNTKNEESNILIKDVS